MRKQTYGSTRHQKKARNIVTKKEKVEIEITIG
jgi:hypothetical protein